MRKIVLGNNPKNFVSDVEVTLPDGDTTVMQVTYKYRTRKQMAALLESMNLSEADLEKHFDMKNAVANTQESIEKDADMLMDVIEGWNLESEFCREKVEQLCDEMPAVVMDIITNYVFGVKKIRQGN